MYLLSKRSTYPAKDQHVTAPSRLPLRSVSYLKHTNEDRIRYQLNDGRNVLLNIYEAQIGYYTLVLRSTRTKERERERERRGIRVCVFGITLARCEIRITRFLHIKLLREKQSRHRSRENSRGR